MGVADIIVIAVVGVAFLAAVGAIIYRKIKHKGGCCDCGNCSACDKCRDKKQN